MKIATSPPAMDLAHLRAPTRDLVLHFAREALGGRIGHLPADELRSLFEARAAAAVEQAGLGEADAEIFRAVTLAAITALDAVVRDLGAIIQATADFERERRAGARMN